MARSWRTAGISGFVIVWVAVFHYETLRLNYLSVLACPAWPLPQRVQALLEPARFFELSRWCPELPKLKFLYPPAGWIMFFDVDRSYGLAEVYGLGPGPPVLLDPHDIFRTRAVLYDNIRRNVLVSVLSPHQAPRFCAYLARMFPSYERFAVVYAQHPDVVARPDEVQRRLAYRCPP